MRVLDAALWCASDFRARFENPRPGEAAQGTNDERPRRRLTHERDRLRLLLEVNNAVVSHLDIRELFKVIAEHIRKVVDYFGLVMTLYDKDSSQLRVYAMEPSPPPGKAPFEEGQYSRGHAHETAFACAARYSCARNSENSSSPLMQRIALDGVKSGCVAPLISRGRILGRFNWATGLEDAFDNDDAELLTQIAGQVALAVENAVAYREISILKARLQEENVYLQEEIRQEHNFEEIIGSSRTLKRFSSRSKPSRPLIQPF